MLFTCINKNFRFRSLFNAYPLLVVYDKITLFVPADTLNWLNSFKDTNANFVENNLLSKLIVHKILRHLMSIVWIFLYNILLLSTNKHRAIPPDRTSSFRIKIGEKEELSLVLLARSFKLLKIIRSWVRVTRATGPKQPNWCESCNSFPFVTERGGWQGGFGAGPTRRVPGSTQIEGIGTPPILGEESMRNSEKRSTSVPRETNGQDQTTPDTSRWYLCEKVLGKALDFSKNGARKTHTWCGERFVVYPSSKTKPRLT